MEDAIWCITNRLPGNEKGILKKVLSEYLELKGVRCIWCTTRNKETLKVHSGSKDTAYCTVIQFLWNVSPIRLEEMPTVESFPVHLQNSLNDTVPIVVMKCRGSRRDRGSFVQLAEIATCLEREVHADFMFKDGFFHVVPATIPLLKSKGYKVYPI